MVVASARPRAARPLRVCLVVPYDIFPEAGGVKQHAVHLMAGLRALGDQVVLIGPASGPVTQPHTVGFRGVVAIRGNGSSNRMGLLCSPWALKRFFDEHPFDVIHMHEPEVPALTYWASWLMPSVAKVVTFHAYAESPPWHVRASRRVVGRWLYQHVHAGIAVSPGAARLARAGFAKDLQIVPNGVDNDTFRPDGPNFLSPWPSQLAKDPFRLLFVGGLRHPRKGARYLLEALQALRAQGRNVVVELVGGRLSAAQIEELGPAVRCHQDVTTQELAQLYRSCDALVAPATGQESFGIILLEAMASGLPIVATDIEGYRHVLDTSHTQGALTVPPHDAQALAQAIAELMDLPQADRKAMGASNLGSIAPFTWPTVVRQVRAIYLSAIHAAQAAP